MKWIRRKPSWKTHAAVFFASVVFILVSIAIVNSQFEFYESNIKIRLRGVTARTDFERIMDGLDRSMPIVNYYVIGKKDGEYLIDKNQMFGLARTEQRTMPVFLLQRTAEFQSGLWAPTRRHRVDALGTTAMFSAGNGDWSINPPDPNQLGLREVLVSDQGLDPKLATNQYTEETGVMLIGYVLNSLWLMATSGLVWSFVWVPKQFDSLLLSRRAASHLCPKCKYDVSATPGKCPECGWGHEAGAGEE